MMGLKDNPEERGIIPNAFEHVFGFIDQSDQKTIRFLVRCSYLEIYNEDIRDLLSKNVDAKLELKEDPDKGVFVKDLTCYIVKNSGNLPQPDRGSNKKNIYIHSLATQEA